MIACTSPGNCASCCVGLDTNVTWLRAENRLVVGLSRPDPVHPMNSGLNHRTHSSESGVGGVATDRYRTPIRSQRGTPSCERTASKLRNRWRTSANAKYSAPMERLAESGARSSS